MLTVKIILNFYKFENLTVKFILKTLNFNGQFSKILGEIFIGYKMDGYNVRPGVAEDYRDEGFSFSLFTPERIYTLSASTSHERDDWMNEIQKVIERQLSPSDISLSARLIRKRNTTMNFLPGR